MKKLFTVFILVSFLFAGLSAQTIHRPVLAESSTDEVVYSSVSLHFPIEKVYLEEVRYEAQNFTDVSLAETVSYNQPGYPALPVKILHFAAPIDSEVGVEVVSGRSQEITISAPVLPFANIERILSDGEIASSEPGLTQQNAVYQADPIVYAGKSLFPPQLASITNDGMLRNQRIISVTIFPIQFDPARGVLVAFDELEVRLSFGGDFHVNESVEYDSTDAEQIFRSTLVNYEQGLKWRASTDQIITDQGLTNLGNLPLWTPPRNSWRIQVSQDGMQRISYQMLAAAGGLPVQVDPAYFKLYYGDQMTPCFITGEDDGSFDNNDSIIFYGEARTGKYSNRNSYWLVLSESTGGLRPATRNLEPGNGPLRFTIKRSLRFEQNITYRSQTKGADNLDRFMWQYLYANNPGTPGNWSTTAALPNATNNQGVLKISFSGITRYSDVYPDHHVLISLNGTQIGNLEWDDQNYVTESYPIPADVLVNGDNTLTLTLPADKGVADGIFLDWFDIEYAASSHAIADRSTINLIEDGRSRYEVDGFSESTIDGYYLKDQELHSIIEGFDVTGTAAGFKVSFEDDYESGNQYEFLATDQYLQPSVAKDNFSELRVERNGADYIIISPAELMIAARSLADYRSGQGYRTMVVDIQDVYDEFSHGNISPEAIRSFLLYAQVHWVKPAPLYVVLMGDGNYDPNHYLSTSSASLIPPYLSMVDPILGETAADNKFVTIIGYDSMPDMMIGRLSVSNLQQAQEVVTKIINYETQVLVGSWDRNVLFVADNPENNMGFPQLSDIMLREYKPSNFSVQKAYLGIDGSAQEISNRIVAAINGNDASNVGTALVNFFGHASYYQWMHENVLNVPGVNSLTNVGKLPVVSSMDCLDSYFIDPKNTMMSISEAFVRNPNGGAVAVYGATGESIASGHEALDRGFLRALYHNGVKTLGEAVIASKLTLWGMGNYFELLDTYMLTGDPATVYKRGLMATNDSYYTNMGQRLSVSAEQGVMANDYNTQDLPGVVTVQVGALVPDKGQLTLNGDGSFDFQPNDGVTGTVIFTYELRSTGGETSNIATVNIEILPPNNIPSDIYLHIVNPLYENYPIGWHFGTMTTTDADPDDIFKYILVDGEGDTDNQYFKINGQYLLTEISFNFEERSEYSIRMRSTDQKGGWVEKVFSIEVLDLNDMPVANPDSLYLIPDVPNMIPTSVLVANDFDEDGDLLTIISVSKPNRGTVELDGEYVIFTPTDNTSGVPSFEYVISDGMFQSSTIVKFDKRYLQWLPIIRNP